MDRARAQKLDFNWSSIDKWIKDHQDASWKVFKKDFKDFPLTDSSYYSRKRRVLGIESSSSSSGYQRRNQYETIGVMDIKEIKELDALSAMKKLLNLLDKHGKTRIEIVRLMDPDSVEIRRSTR